MPRFFKLKELIYSATAVSRHIDNLPDFEEVERLQELTDTILDPLRQAWGSGIKVNSGFRCALLNNAVGGSPTSAHLKGYAADLSPVNGKVDEFIAFAIRWVKDNRIRFDQMIDEYGKNGTHWLHIGLYNNSGQQRGQIFSLKK